MGANHFSQSVFGAEPEQVREILVRWLRAKGFEEQPGEPLAPLDPEHERGLILAWKGDRVVVLYDHLAEQPRLLFELKKLPVPVLDYWMHDSDIWGYQLWRDGAVIDAFHSDPAYFGGYEDIAGPRDIPALCAAVGVSGREGEIEALQRKKAVFTEEISAKFVEVLGVAPAAAQYGYAASGTWPTRGFQQSRLWFRHADWDPMAGWDVDQLRVEVIDPATAWQADLSDEERAEYEAQMRRAQWMGRLMQVVLWPISLATRAWFWWKMRAMRAEIERRQQAGEPLVDPVTQHYEMAFEVEGGRMVNPTHGCSMPVPDGGVVTDYHRAKISPGTVFRFQWGEQHLALNAMMPKAAQQMCRFGPADSEVAEEELEAGDRAVRWIEVVWDASFGPDQESRRQWRVLAFVAGPRAVYQLSAGHSNPPDPEFVAACKAAVTGLRFHETDSPSQEEA